MKLVQRWRTGLGGRTVFLRAFLDFGIQVDCFAGLHVNQELKDASSPPCSCVFTIVFTYKGVWGEG